VLSESQRSEFFDAAVQARQLIASEYDSVFQSGVRFLAAVSVDTCTVSR
jgi:hypothetical protein